MKGAYSFAALSGFWIARLPLQTCHPRHLRHGWPSSKYAGHLVLFLDGNAIKLSTGYRSVSTSETNNPHFLEHVQ